MEKIQLAIIGSGPAGYSAGVYAARALLAPTIFTGLKSGGQLMFTTDVENYAGFQEGVEGPQLMFQMRQQSEKFGAKLVDKYVTAVDLSARPFKIWDTMPDGYDPTKFEKITPEEYQKFRTEVMKSEPAVEAESVIISTGATSKMTGAKGEEKLFGKGLSVCAVCDAAFFKEKKTFVIGGGDSAMEDAMALTKFASEVTILHRREEFRASKIMQDRVLANPKIKVMWNTTLKEVIGEQKVEKIIVSENGKDVELPADGVFIAIGHIPVTQIFDGQVERDEHGYVVTRQSYSKQGLDMASAALSDAGLVAYPSMTSVEGVFAGGDNVDVRYKQAITAAGMGCMAALDAEKWLEAYGSEQAQPSSSESMAKNEKSAESSPNIEVEVEVENLDEA